MKEQNPIEESIMTLEELNELCEKEEKLVQERGYHKFGKWKVYFNGDIDRIDGSYFIENSRLEKEYWIPHIALKNNKFDLGGFVRAYMKALDIKGIEIEFVNSGFEKIGYGL